MIYEYECTGVCLRTLEVEQRITDPKLTECIRCGSPNPKRLISGAPGFVLKSGPAGSWGSGGYALTEPQRKAEAKLGRKVIPRAE